AEIDAESVLNGTDVRKNDIITHVNGNPLNKANVLLSAVENGKVGDSLKLTLCRVNQNYDISTFEVSVKLVEDKGSSEEATTEPSLWNPFQEGYGW
ncbi:MAG: PDZ domain-containing protein, partial [Oscillospiraceae bacterium]|nr:PDZ domain-containing protein [Oscillospiraceae bacterium]